MLRLSSRLGCVGSRSVKLPVTGSGASISIQNEGKSDIVISTSRRAAPGSWDEIMREVVHVAEGRHGSRSATNPPQLTPRVGCHALRGSRERESRSTIRNSGPGASVTRG